MRSRTGRLQSVDSDFDRDGESAESAKFTPGARVTFKATVLMRSGAPIFDFTGRLLHKKVECRVLSTKL
jgi:hypothetical protein